MSGLRQLAARIAGLFRGDRMDRSLDDEVRFHVDMLTAEYLRKGLNPTDARAAAVRDFGGVMQTKEAYRDQRSVPQIETFIQDARYAVRTLVRTPAFTLAALLTLALGIGANTAIFSVVHAVLLRPLPYPEPDRIVQFARRNQAGEGFSHTGLRYLYFRDGLQSFQSFAARRGLTGVNMISGDRAQYVQALPVSKEFFDVFAARFEMGRSFTAEEDSAAGPEAVVLAHALWRRQFAGNRAILGRTVLLGERRHIVVGVTAADFESIPRADVYVPLRPGTTGPGGGFNYEVIGRLKPGVTREQAVAQAAGVFESFRRDYPGAVGPTEYSPSFVPYQESLSAGVRQPLIIMLGAVGLLLLIACANTANLLLARASGRAREVAVRAALGAGRGRIVRQLLTESVLLSLAGAALGVLLAYWAVPALLAVTPPALSVHQDVRIDAPVLAVTFGLAVVTGLLFGLAPALNLSRHDLVEAFKDEGARTSGSRRAAWIRKGLAVAEIALCMLLLVGAGLLVRTFLNLRAVDPGFDVRGVLTARMSLQGDRHPTAADMVRFFEDGLERIRRIPGVESAAVVNGVPIERGLNLNVDILDGPTKLEGALTDWRYASADYFQTMRIPVVAGRAFTGADHAGSPPVAVVSEQFARQFFGTVDALGHHIRVFDDDGSIEIVGIAKDVRERGLVGRPLALMYVPVAQANVKGLRTSHTYFPMSWVVRARNTGPELIRQIEEQLRLLDPRQPVASFRTMEEVRARHMEMERFQMTLLGGFGVVGLLLASAGIYGLLAYSVAQRTREFGIRVALGATGGRILLSVVRQGAALAVLGVALGAFAAVAATRALRTAVYGVSTLDPVTFAAVGALLIAVATLASLVPAMRALRLNPVAALRE